ncbi:MAG: hypothetical protein WC647_06835 [Desulfomonilaceae bacterium]|jgi:hypothetical protein
MGKNKTTSQAIEIEEAPPVEFATEEASEDYLDYCAASESIAEALVSGEIRPFDEFAKELGI